MRDAGVILSLKIDHLCTHDKTLITKLSQPLKTTHVYPVSGFVASGDRSPTSRFSLPRCQRLRLNSSAQPFTRKQERMAFHSFLDIKESSGEQKTMHPSEQDPICSSSSSDHPEYTSPISAAQSSDVQLVNMKHKGSAATSVSNSSDACISTAVGSMPYWSAPKKRGRIVVCVRKRPRNEKGSCSLGKISLFTEISMGDMDVISIPTQDHIVLCEPRQRFDLTEYLEHTTFRFDRCFDENATTAEVYRHTAAPMVSSIFQGYMATCFAYGQTGSGKTFTMGGPQSGSTNLPLFKGGIYGMVAYAKEFTISVSFFEIYCNKVYDLLNQKLPLRVMEDAYGTVQLLGLREYLVKDTKTTLSLLRHGYHLRTNGQTVVNEHSSRSHAIFQVLRESFVGKRSCTSMIATVSPGLSCCEHSMNTFRYAQRVKHLVPSAFVTKLTSRNSLRTSCWLPELDRSSDLGQRATLQNDGVTCVSNGRNHPVVNGRQPLKRGRSFTTKASSTMSNKKLRFLRVQKQKQDLIRKHEDFIKRLPQWIAEHQKLLNRANKDKANMFAYVTLLTSRLNRDIVQLKKIQGDLQQISNAESQIRGGEHVADRERLQI
ncbi:kinesin family member 2/24 [Paragonimus westermani]|uniref:Kinesin family member 2/24 n=1 Tax=Paragonimus westermani TaxID=34504 RepID=A0A5J4NN15_9TREM|nr:kinesin family member 2/24 [Paragonimus westermani]